MVALPVWTTAVVEVLSMAALVGLVGARERLDATEVLEGSLMG